MDACLVDKMDDVMVGLMVEPMAVYLVV